MVRASIVLTLLLGSAASTRAEPAHPLGAQLLAGTAFTHDEALPLVIGLASVRFGPVSLEAGLSSFLVRVDATAGVRVFPDAASGVYLSGRVSKMLFATIDAELSEAPTAAASAGYERHLGRMWSVAGELGAVWILESHPDRAFTALLATSCRFQ
jgi:hypothetical protein